MSANEPRYESLDLADLDQVAGGVSTTYLQTARLGDPNATGGFEPFGPPSGVGGGLGPGLNLLAPPQILPTALAQPGFMQPGLMQPGLMQPGLMQPGLMQPGLMPPGLMEGLMQPGLFQQALQQGLQTLLAPPTQAARTAPPQVPPGYVVVPESVLEDLASLASRPPQVVAAPPPPPPRVVAPPPQQNPLSEISQGLGVAQQGLGLINQISGLMRAFGGGGGGGMGGLGSLAGMFGGFGG